MARSHKDVEFHVELANGKTQVYRKFDEAAGMAVSLAASGRPTTIDVVIWSRAGARAYGGDWGVEQYNEDPEASVFERIEVEANNLGRIP